MTDETERPALRPYRKHILVCGGSKCAPEAGAALYQWLKDRIKELKLNEGPDRIQRTQCHCLGICKAGPIAVVYPDDVWYYQLDPQKMERVIQEHLIGGKPVAEFMLHSASNRD